MERWGELREATLNWKQPNAERLLVDYSGTGQKFTTQTYEKWASLVQTAVLQNASIASSQCQRTVIQSRGALPERTEGKEKDEIWVVLWMDSLDTGFSWWDNDWGPPHCVSTLVSDWAQTLGISARPHGHTHTHTYTHWPRGYFLLLSSTSPIPRTCIKCTQSTPGHADRQATFPPQSTPSLAFSPFSSFFCVFLIKLKGFRFI